MLEVEIFTYHFCASRGSNFSDVIIHFYTYIYLHTSRCSTYVDMFLDTYIKLLFFQVWEQLFEYRKRMNVAVYEGVLQSSASHLFISRS